MRAAVSGDFLNVTSYKHRVTFIGKAPSLWWVSEWRQLPASPSAINKASIVAVELLLGP